MKRILVLLLALCLLATVGCGKEENGESTAAETWEKKISEELWEKMDEMSDEKNTPIAVELIDAIDYETVEETFFKENPSKDTMDTESYNKIYKRLNFFYLRSFKERNVPENRPCYPYSPASTKIYVQSTKEEIVHLAKQPEVCNVSSVDPFMHILIEGDRWDLDFWDID